MIKRIVCIAVAVLLGAGWIFVPSADARDIPTIVKSEDLKKVGLTAFSFLKVTQSARVAGMGDAFTAVADDINSIYFNPAGLGQIKGFAYTFTYTKWLVDTAFYSGALAYNTPKGVIGLSVVNYDFGDVEVRTIYNPLGTGEMIKSGASAIGLAYAFTPTDKLNIGMRVSYVQETLHNDSMNSVVFDVGTHFYTGFKSARIAMSMKNFGPDADLLSVEQKFLMPMYFDVGAAMEVYGEKGDPASLTVSFESAFPIDYAQRWHVGGELWIANTLALRGGYKFNYDEEDYSLGVGIRGTFGERTIFADLAYSNFGNKFDKPIRLSIGGSF